MATILNSLRRIFRRKRTAPLACSVSLDASGEVVADDPNHVHTAACFVDFEPLAVIELFQSQGCVACPPTVPEIFEASNSPNVLLLSYNVTIFDHLGWKDTFATQDTDRRHRDYARAWDRTSLYTPQAVANGAVDGNGAGGRTEIMDLVARARTIQKATGWNIYLDANDTEIRIDTDRAEAEVHNILLVVYRGGDEIVKAGRGPNKGKKLKHRNVVRQVIKIGEWQGGSLVMTLPTPRSSMQQGEEAAVLVQAGAGGPIIAAVKL